MVLVKGIVLPVVRSLGFKADLLPWEGAQVGLEEFQEVASLPRCLLTKEQMEVWDCRSGGNLMCLLSSKSDVPVLFKKAKAVFPCNEQHFFFFSSLTKD